jgi:hypothetical protein
LCLPNTTTILATLPAFVDVGSLLCFPNPMWRPRQRIWFFDLLIAPEFRASIGWRAHLLHGKLLGACSRLRLRKRKENGMSMKQPTHTRPARRISKFIAYVACIVLTTNLPAMSEEAEYEDFSDVVTQRCEVIGLIATPPDGWFNIPMQAMPDQLRGCQMLHVDGDDTLLGIIRLVSVLPGPGLSSDDVRDQLVSLEMSIWTEMGFQVGGPIWVRDEVPLRGDGFDGASAIGLSAIIAESGLPQEIHVLTFRHEPTTTQYVLSLITPRAEEDADAHRGNLEGFAAVMGGLVRPSGE